LVQRSSTLRAKTDAEASDAERRFLTAQFALTVTGVQGADRHPQRSGYVQAMKKILELLVCFLHPVAVVLMWIDLATRRNIGGGAKLAWAVFGLVPLVPFLYVLTGGELW
jgi:hypothetical protein